MYTVSFPTRESCRWCVQLGQCCGKCLTRSSLRRLTEIVETHCSAQCLAGSGNPGSSCTTKEEKIMDEFQGCLNVNNGIRAMLVGRQHVKHRGRPTFLHSEPLGSKVLASGSVCCAGLHTVDFVLMVVALQPVPLSRKEEGKEVAPTMCTYWQWLDQLPVASVQRT